MTVDRGSTSTLFETADVDFAYEKLSRLYGVRRFTVTGEQPSLRLSQETFGPVEIHRFSFTMEAEIDAAPLGALFLGHVINGTVAYHYGRDDQDSHGYRTGDVYLVAQPDSPYRAEIGNLDRELAVLDIALLAQVADTAPGRRAVPIRFTGYRPATPEDASRWLRTFTFVRDQLRATPAANQPLVTGAAARLLAATALSVFPNNTLVEPTTEDGHDASPPTLRRAVVFIDDNAHRDISIADIAAAAFVTTRAVQLAFRRHMDTTPMEYLRRVRLAHAHRDLVTGDPARESVTAVAYRWGFPNPGRFAIQYRQAYGVAPSRTLRSG